jgi:hypothetical protein
MSKAKNKIGQQNFWQKFYNRYVLVRHDFRYEIDHEPQELLAALDKFWRRDGKYYNIAITELEEGKVWKLNLWHKRYSSQILAKIYSEDDKTIMEGMVHLSDHSPLFYILIGWVFLMLSPLILIITQATNISDSIGPMLIFSIILIVGLWGRNTILNEHKQLIDFMEKFIEKEEKKLYIEWEKLYKKEKISGQ